MSEPTARSVLGRATDVGARVPVAVSAGIATTLPLFAILHDLVPIHPPSPVSWSIGVGLLAISARWLGRPVVAALAARAALGRGTVAVLAALLGAAPVLMPLLTLLRDPVDPVAQLAWTLGEEDNAQVIGLAREVITDGPSGGVLADQYGTGVIVVATTLMRMTASPDPDLDPRFLAIHAFTLSTLVAVLVLAASIGLLVAVISATGRHGSRVIGLGTVMTGIVTASATAIALKVVVLVPMRTGFLTFVWGMAWTVLATCIAAIAVRAADRRASLLAAAAVLAAALLLIRSWPFLGAAILPAAAVTASLLPLDPVLRWARSRPLMTALTGGVLLVAAVLYLRRSALGEVLSYGLDALTISASGIEFADGVGFAAAGATLVAAVMLTTAEDRARRVAVIAGPAVMGWLSWAALNGAAGILTDGELNYGGTKLLYGVVGVATATALPIAMTSWSRSGGLRAPAGALAAVALGVIVWTGAPVAELQRWAERLEPSSPPHAEAMIEAVRRTTPDLPVRCRPEPGTPVTGTSRWAAYFCIRWVEDALNGPGRDDGQRFGMLEAASDTFDPVVAEATAEGLYGFAYVMPLGPGWFGWDGRS